MEGSITTAEDEKRIRDVRRVSKRLVTIGACATAGGIQALRNFRDVREFAAAVYARPDYIETLATSTPISAHVPVDFELRGCPISKAQLLEVIGAFLHGRRPNTPAHSVCMECKQRGTVCVMVAHGTPCLGPITHAGCGAICPAYRRGCYGCFGPMETPNTGALADEWRRLGRCARGDRAGAAHLQRLGGTLPQGGRTAWRSGPLRPPRLRASRAKARFACGSRTARSNAPSSASTSRRGFSRRSCALARSPRPPTSSRASAASARSLTR
ncbi:MAG: hypothetical protein RML56_05685 [Burkholderiales bacterium]|nr:hypothetical protein [Burkholderiales bacterium]